MGHGRIIGIDYGRKRVGLAISDPLAFFARPLGAFEPSAALDELTRLHAHEGIERLVVGWPLLPDGSFGESARQVSHFVRRLQKRFPDVAVIRWNEEYTTEHAKELIAAGGKPSLRTSGKGRLDAAAAGVILQEYLDDVRRKSDGPFDASSNLADSE
jgi:putative Holliday junction resolvase